MNSIQTYAPIINCSDDDVEIIYDDISNYFQQDLVQNNILMGESIAKLGLTRDE